MINNLTYPQLIWKQHRGFTIFSVVFITILQFLIIEMITDTNVAPIVAVILDQLPEPMRMLINEELLSRFSVEGAAAFGFNHPFVLALLAINAIVIPTRQISGEIESGTLELLLSYPIRRSTLLLLLWTSASALLIVTVLAALVGSLAAVAVFHRLDYSITIHLLQIAVNLFLLYLLIMSYSLLLASLSKTGDNAGMRAAGITLVFYFLHFFSTVWEEIGFTKPFNIFSYYQPQKLMFDQRSITLNVVALTVTIGICVVLSLLQFNRRDIPG